MNESFHEYEEYQAPAWMRSGIIAYISLVTISGTIMNGIVIIAFYKNKVRKIGYYKHIRDSVKQRLSYCILIKMWTVLLGFKSFKKVIYT